MPKDMTGIEFSGLETVMKNLNQAVKDIGGARSRAGMRRALQFIKKESLALTPIDIGNLRGSVFTEVTNEGENIVGTIGYTAEYAVYVHEINKNYTVGQWKFLEKPIAENHDRILAEIVQEIGLK